MANKTTKSKKDNKNLIIGLCAGLAVVVIAIVIIVLATQNSGINDSYFVSDGTKYVLTIDTSDEDSEDTDDYTPLKTHLVYTYEGDTVTGLKSYYEYADAASAKTAYDAMKKAAEESESSELDQMEVNGKYIIITASQDVYQDMTASDVKQQIEFMESLKNMDTNDSDDTTDTETVDAEEEDEE